jgi:hypothetical protein
MRHHKIFAERISQGNIGWKIVSCDRTCTHDGSAATYVATCHIKQSLNFVLNKNVHIISTAIVRKKYRDLKEVANCCVTCTPWVAQTSIKLLVN